MTVMLLWRLEYITFIDTPFSLLLPVIIVLGLIHCDLLTRQLLFNQRIFIEHLLCPCEQRFGLKEGPFQEKKMAKTVTREWKHRDRLRKKQWVSLTRAKSICNCQMTVVPEKGKGRVILEKEKKLNREIRGKEITETFGNQEEKRVKKAFMLHIILVNDVAVKLWE